MSYNSNPIDFMKRAARKPKRSEIGSEPQHERKIMHGGRLNFHLVRHCGWHHHHNIEIVALISMLVA